MATILLSIFSILLSGCLFSGDDEPSYDLTTLDLPLILQGSQCGNAHHELSATLLKGPAQIEQAFKNLSASQPLELVNRYSLALWIRDGQKSTAGYHLDVHPTAQLSSKTLSLWVDEKRPGFDVRVAQVITSPCALVLLPKSDYQFVQLQGELPHLPMKFRVP
jgi:hypothetical protein